MTEADNSNICMPYGISRIMCRLQSTDIKKLLINYCFALSKPKANFSAICRQKLIPVF